MLANKFRVGKAYRVNSKDFSYSSSVNYLDSGVLYLCEGSVS